MRLGAPVMEVLAIPHSPGGTLRLIQAGEYPSIGVARRLGLCVYHGVVKVSSSPRGLRLCSIRYADFRERLPSGQHGE